MTMREYTELMTVEKMKPVETVYDKETQDLMIGNFETKRLLDG